MYDGPELLDVPFMFCAEKQAQNFIDHTNILFVEHTSALSGCTMIISNNVF